MYGTRSLLRLETTMRGGEGRGWEERGGDITLLK